MKNIISKSAFVLFLLTAVLTTPASSGFVVTPAPRAVGWGASKAALSMSTITAGAEALATYEKNVEAMRGKDKTSKSLSKADLKVVHEDDHIVVVDKPSGVLSVSGKDENPSLAAAVFEAFGCEGGKADKMVAQRLGFDTSGLMVFAKTDKAISGLNKQLKSRSMGRIYEALLCGHVGEASGEIDYALQRDPDALPYMRVYTPESQKALVEMAPDLPEGLEKKLCKNEQPSLTKYEVVGKEELGDQPVTRVTLSSVSGRTHQLNVHCAAIGHPIVGDKTYGINGVASENGGFDDITMAENAPNRASAEVQKNIAVQGKGLCVHLKELSFKHPVTNEDLSFTSSPPF